VWRQNGGQFGVASHKKDAERTAALRAVAGAAARPTQKDSVRIHGPGHNDE